MTEATLDLLRRLAEHYCFLTDKSWEPGQRRPRGSIQALVAALRGTGKTKVDVKRVGTMLQSRNNGSSLSRDWPSVQAALSDLMNDADLMQAVQSTERIIIATPSRTDEPEWARDLRGAWLLVHNSVKRADTRKRPPTGQRVCLLRYGAHEQQQVRFELVGQTTLWNGVVTRHNDFLYFTADETSESARLGMHPREPERVNLIMRPLSARAHVHKGIISGIVTGGNDASIEPIYASHAILWKVDGGEELDGILSDGFAELARWRPHFIPTLRKSREANNPLTKIMKEGMRFFEALTPKRDDVNNEGTRIIVRL